MPRSTGWREGGLLVAAAVAAALLAACTPSPGTPGSLPTTTVPTPTMSSPVAPTESSSGSELVETAVRGFVSAINAAIAGQGTDAYVAVTTDKCTCRDLVTSVEGRAKRGETASGGLWTIAEVTASEPTPGGRSVAQMSVHEAGYEVKDKAGRKIESGGARDTEWIVILTLDGGAWLVSDVDPA